MEATFEFHATPPDAVDEEPIDREFGSRLTVDDARRVLDGSRRERRSNGGETIGLAPGIAGVRIGPEVMTT